LEVLPIEPGVEYQNSAPGSIYYSLALPVRSRWIAGDHDRWKCCQSLAHGLCYYGA